MKYGNTTIGGMSFGSTRIGGAKYGNTLVFNPGSPQPTTTIPYIRNTGLDAYIDTGITADATTRVVIWARNFNIDTLFLFGSRISGTDRAFSLFADSGANSGYIGIGYGNTSTFLSNDQVNYLSDYHKYELNAGALLIDDVQIGVGSGTFSSDNNKNIHLFGLNNNGTHVATRYPVDVCAVKIYKGGSLVRNFTPVSSPSVGLYDSVSDTVFTNAGNSGSFTYGTFNSNAYSRLDYVECTGGQYIDTGLVGGYSLPIFAVATPTSSTPGWYVVVGSRNGTSAMCYLNFGDGTTANSKTSVAYIAATKHLYSSVVTGDKIVFTKKNNVFTANRNHSQLGTYTGGASTSFSSVYNCYVGGMNSSGNLDAAFVGRIYYVGMGSKNFVPALVGGVAGFYDTFNDVFYPSASGTPFVAGTTI